jgi:hypothetical protein
MNNFVRDSGTKASWAALPELGYPPTRSWSRGGLTAPRADARCAFAATSGLAGND